MFNIGDYVVYKRDGVCKVINIDHPLISSAEKSSLYYYLQPVKYTGMIYIPVDSENSLRPVISHSAAENLVASLDAIPADISRTRDKKALVAHYENMLRPNTCNALAQTVKSIYEKHITSTGALGRIPAMEEQIMRRSEQALYEELGVALGISEADVKVCIESSIGRSRKSAATEPVQA